MALPDAIASFRRSLDRAYRANLAATPPTACCFLNRTAGQPPIGKIPASVSQFADVGAHGAHGQIQRFGNLAFRLPFPPQADEQGIPL